jgi:hypothetical protein
MSEMTGLRGKNLDFERLNSAVVSLRGKQIFFVGGTMKSGTTWLQLLLNAHPRVSCNGEGHFVDSLASNLKQALDFHWKFIADKNRSIFQELKTGIYPALADEDVFYVIASCISLFLIRQSKSKEATAIGERTPDNIDNLEMLDLLFPNAKFLQIVRDGRDCAVSGWFHNLRITPHWTKKNFGSLRAYAVRCAEAWAEQIADGQRFAERHPGRFLRVRYEDLTSDTERVLAGLFEFLGVARDESVIAHCRSEASFTKLSGGRHPGQENRRSFFRKGVAGDWRNHFSSELDAEFRKHSGGWLDRLGYG